MPDDDEIERLYGPWRERTPRDAVDLMDGYTGVWWISGGWAIEAFTGVSRPHGDLDLSIPRCDVARFRRHVAGRLDVWAADKGTMRPLVVPEEEPSGTCGNLWLRPSGAEPWAYDVLLMNTTDATWTYKRDGRISRPLDEILWVRDGIKYLRPEVQLLHKAKDPRPKDRDDFRACVSLLEEPARCWLAAALAVAHPGHPWIARLGVAHPSRR